MGKKVSTKTSKNVEKQLHNLVNVLKPKVYITHSSSFKQLVQQLTGYRTQTTTKPQDAEKVVPVIEIEDHHEHGETLPAITTTTLSMDSSLGSFELCDVDQPLQLEEINQITGLMQTADDDNISMFDHMSNFTTNYQQTDWLAYQNLESWLLDADAEPYYTQQRDLSLFDYELLSGLVR